MDGLRIAARLVFIALVGAISVIAGFVALAAGPSSPFVASAASTTFATHHYDSASQHAMRRVGAETAAAQPVASHAVVRLLTVKTTTSLAAEAGAPATRFVGRKGTTKAFDDGSSATYGGEIGIARGTNAAGEVGGRQYSGHAFDQMQGRGITPSVVDDAIQNAAPLPGADVSSIFYSGRNNISVVINRDGRVITVGYGQFKPR